MHPVYTSFGAEGFLDLGDGWSVKEAFRNIQADVQFNAIFSVNNPVTAAGYAESQVENVLDVDCTVLDCSNYYQYSFTHDGPIPASAANTLNGNGLVVESGWWTVTKPLRNIVNDLRISKEFSGEIENTITGGFYFSDYSADEFWLFNNVLQEVRDAPRLLDLTIMDDGGDPVVDVTDNGFTRYGALYRNASSNARVWALYLQDEWQATPQLKIDGGLRYEYATFKGNVEARSVYDLGDPNTLADDRMEYGNGDFLPYNFDHDNVAWSIGANYMFTQQFGMFGRFTDAFRMPDFEQWTDGSVNSAGKVEDILQGEVGVKYGSPQLGVFATGFWSQLKDTPFTDEVVVDGDLVTLRRFANTRTIGVETEAVWIPWNTLQFNWTGTLQQPEYTNLRFDLPPGVNLDLPPDFNIDGNRIRRVPRYISSLRGSYTLPPEAGNLKFWLTWNYIDKRFVDDANNVTLPAYNRIDGGLQFDVGPRVQVQLVGNNLTNEIGLTEGNPRVGQVVGVQQDIYMARPILGANGRLSIAYRF
jgi:outer membrane receptor protein involved in Fe transport